MKLEAVACQSGNTHHALGLPLSESSPPVVTFVEEVHNSSRQRDENYSPEYSQHTLCFRCHEICNFFAFVHPRIGRTFIGLIESMYSLFDIPGKTEQERIVRDLNTLALCPPVRLSEPKLFRIAIRT